MGRGLKIATIRGIPIRVHLSLWLVLPLLGFIFGEAFRRAAFFAGVPPERIVGSPYLWGLGVAVALFVAVLVHELAHSLYALKKGGEVRAISLMMIGGVSQVSRPPQGARAEAVMAAVGPASSLLIGGVFWALYTATAGAESFNLRFALFYLAYLNLLIGVFNLLPAFPMDGGRILRAALTGILGRPRATRVAAGVGKVMSAALAMVAVYTFNLFLLVIAVFIFIAAESEAQQERTLETLSRMRVADLMARNAVTLGSDLDVETATTRMLEERAIGLPVLADGQLVGLVTMRDLARADHGVGTSIGSLVRVAPTLTPSDDVSRAYQLMGETELPVLAVVNDGELVGMISRDDIARGMQLRELRERAQAARGWPFRRRGEAST